MKKVLFEAKNLRPSAMLSRMLKHKGDVSIGSKAKVTARRIILGRKVTFYENGLRIVNDNDLNEDDEYKSEVLRLAHASILIGQPVGDKKSCYVDASTNPVTVVIYNMPAEQYIKMAKEAIKNGKVSKEFMLDSTIQEIRHERNVRLFGR